jgi:hypothetical protein
MPANGPSVQPDEEFVDLLIKQVTEGLLPDEQSALDELDAATATAYREELERSVAALTVAGTAADAASLPAPLRARLQEQADVYFKAAAGMPTSRAPAVPASAAPPPPAPTARSTAAPAARSGSLGWWAAAACLLLALFAWFRPTPVVSAADLRASLLKEPDTIKVALGATQDPAAAGVRGDVVWDPRTQRGYVHFVGLPGNDPHVQQYQIWIFDGTRDARYPIDGGLFDVASRGEDVVVPIRAAIPVHDPKAFAVTIEKAGGVVVSTRDHVVALGQTT